MVDPTDPLTTPSHAALHNAAEASLASLGARVTTVEDLIVDTADDVRQARWVANTWAVPGRLQYANESLLILPVLWNLTPRAVEFQAAIASVLVAPSGGEVEVDLVLGSTLATGPGTSILKSTLVIPDGQYSSPLVGVSGFRTTVMAPETYVAMVVLTIGPVDTPGESLTVQLDRLL